jgi:glutathione peroxidase
MKTILLALTGFLFLTAATSKPSHSVYKFSVAGIDGGKIKFKKYKGKKILIVNTASKCGYTPQYADLQKLYQTYGEKLVVVGVPANNFGQQEPGENPEIKTFCSEKFGVTFPLAAKVSVKGEDMHPLYKWLTQKSENGVMDAEVKWNFTKFLLDENGKLLKVFSSKVNPMSEEITSLL